MIARRRAGHHFGIGRRIRPRDARDMPAPIDWTSAGGLDSVRQLTIAVGPREAASRLHLSNAHAEALRRRCSRESWMDAARPRSPVGPSSIVGVPIVRAVPGAPKGSDALADVMREDSRATRIAGARYARRVVEHAAAMPVVEALTRTRNVREAVGVAATVHGWEAKEPLAQPVVNVAVLLDGYHLPDRNEQDRA